ncbi:MAG: hypothetical protein ACXVFT_06685 [Solirubrobacteraceae bacterium]
MLLAMTLGLQGGSPPLVAVGVLALLPDCGFSAALGSRGAALGGGERQFVDEAHQMNSVVTHSSLLDGRSARLYARGAAAAKALARPFPGRAPLRMTGAVRPMTTRRPGASGLGMISGSIGVPNEDGDRMTGAIFGLVGVIVGGLLTGTVETVRERLSQRTLSRAAARLLSAELSVQQVILEKRATDASAEPVSDGMPGVADWPEQRVVMAKTLDDDTWRAVAAAYANLVIWHSQSRPTANADVKRREMAELALQLKCARWKLHELLRLETEPAATEAASG